MPSELKKDIGRKSRNRFKTIKAPEGYLIVGQKSLTGFPTHKIRIFFEHI